MAARIREKKIAIIKTGSAAEPVASVYGDFERWFTEGMGLEFEQVLVIDAPAGDPLPEFHEFDALLITGSSAMVTDRKEWSENLAGWLRALFPTTKPVLGVCYGHQIIADALGGEVGRNPEGREIGTISVDFSGAELANDPVLGGLSGPLPAQSSHSQTVLKLAPGFRAFAKSDKDPHQACFAPPACWTVQFHPEFRGDVMGAFIELRAENLRAEGLDDQKLLAGVGDSPEVAGLLKRFAALVFAQGDSSSSLTDAQADSDN